MKYLPLLNLYLTHSYYADWRCPDFQINPTPETQRLLKNHRCIMKPLSNGAQILVAATDDSPMFIPLGRDTTFAFQLMLQTPGFALFTDLSRIVPSTVPLYTNKRVNTDGPTPLELVSSRSQSRPQKTSGVFADVEIAYRNSAPAIASGPGQFKIEFEAKQARWKYYVVTDHASGLFHIADQDPDTPLTFNAMKDQPTSADKIAATLVEQYPKMRLLRFMSAAAIPFRQKPRKTLQLFTDTTLAVNMLPNPSLRNYTLNVNTEGVPAEHCLFQVVTFFSYLSSTSGG